MVKMMTLNIRNEIYNYLPSRAFNDNQFFEEIRNVFVSFLSVMNNGKSSEEVSEINGKPPEFIKQILEKEI